jgi:hypothetical protein
VFSILETFFIGNCFNETKKLLASFEIVILCQSDQVLIVYGSHVVLRELAGLNKAITQFNKSQA